MITSPFERELKLLREGDLGIVEQLVESSNVGFIVDLELADDYAWAVYKPELGEQPLWDFPPGLYRRERAAFVLSEFLGWHLVPPTIIVEDAPAGVGSMQWFVHNNGEHYFQLFDTRPDLHQQFVRMAVFDLLCNNTDRKSGHVLLEEDHIWGIDHGLCFSVEPKLRTVIWDFAGCTISDELITAVEPLLDEVPAELGELLHPVEIEALQRRASRIQRLPFLPQARSHRQFPWPLV
ncbi:SCO1664 family protein [Corynebacterium crudilactis]|uniref:Phosphatidylinositol kinase n=1 Tax=Corynebacterium crudilactis TaxID=1652495 RepID=A0A172QSK8_9CORY|nr:SCO1664 family protein [Corynebacterium crudilactis]ANE03652.1 phosphatidylinositol kinase [Corynebacterium crudilactis]